MLAPSKLVRLLIDYRAPIRGRERGLVMPTIYLSIIPPTLVFAGFVVLASLVGKGDRPAFSAPLRVFICYVVAVSMYAGLSGRDLWPFAAWRYVAYAVGDTGGFARLVGLDEAGREVPLDTRTLEPLEFAAVMGDLDWTTKGIAHINGMMRFILKRTQEGLAHAHEGRPVGEFSRLLGRFAAPVFHVAVTPWSDRDHLPNRIEQLRLYAVYWQATGGEAHIVKQELITSVGP
jgi:hypothetical protein